MTTRSLLRAVSTGATVALVLAASQLTVRPASAQQYPPAPSPTIIVGATVPPPTAAPPASQAPVPAAAPKVEDPTTPLPAANVLGETLTPGPNVAVESANIAAVSPAYTGASSSAFAAVGVALFVVGAFLLAISRRRRPAAA